MRALISRLDVILDDGARRRANYDTDKPKTIEIAKCPFGPKDVMMKGASCITTNPDLKKMLNDNGFQTQRPGKKNNYCVRMDDEMADTIFEIAQENGMKEPAIIRIAIQHWLNAGHPME